MKRAISRLIITAAIFVCSSVAVLGQSDVTRTTLAITYPLDQTIEVPFHGTTRLPRLKGSATVRRQARRGTRVQLNIDNLPRAYELGGVYTTYVLWAISPDGHVDNLGEIKRSGSGLLDSKIDGTTPLQTFALLVTAEPHFLVHAPSRMVVMENLAPANIRDAQLETTKIQYIGNTSDYFRDSRVPPIAETDFREIPVALLGARQAINLARYAGAERDAPTELRAAQADLEQAESAQRMHQPDREIDILARQAISSGAKAEDMALVRRTARERREELERRDAAVKRAADQRAAADNLKQALSRFLAVRETNRGMTLVLAESLWLNPRSSKLAAASAAKLDQIGALLANNPDYQITIESYTDNSGDASALEQLTQDRARVLSERLAAAGVDVTRLPADGMGAAKPIPPNTTLGDRATKRRD